MTNIEKTLKLFEEKLVYLAGVFTRGGMSNKENYEILTDLLTQTRKDTLEEVEGKMPNKKIELRSVEDVGKTEIDFEENLGNIGFNDCLTEIKSLLAELKDKSE